MDWIRIGSPKKNLLPASRKSGFRSKLQNPGIHKSLGSLSGMDTTKIAVSGFTTHLFLGFKIVFFVLVFFLFSFFFGIIFFRNIFCFFFKSFFLNRRFARFRMILSNIVIIRYLLLHIKKKWCSFNFSIFLYFKI